MIDSILGRRARRHRAFSPPSGSAAEPPPSVTYLVNDDFTDTVSAGSVDGTSAAPGPGTRDVDDTGSIMPVGSGVLYCTAVTTGNGSPRYVLGSQTRAVGKRFVTRILSDDAFSVSNVAFVFGWFSAASGVYTNNVESLAYRSDTSQLTRFAGSLNTIVHDNKPDGTYNECVVILRATGAFYVVDDELIYIADVGTTTPLYPGITAAAASRQPFKVDYIRIPEDAWAPTPLVSDGFGSSFGTTDGLGHEEGVNGGVGAGGSGLSWTTVTGGWTTAAGVATPTGIPAIAQLNVSEADVVVRFRCSTVSAKGGLIARYVDSSNYLLASIVNTGGTYTVGLEQILSGSPTTLISFSTQTFGALKFLTLHLNGSSARLYYANVLIGTTSSINAALVSATRYGIYGNSISLDQLNDFSVYAFAQPDAHV